MPGIPGKYEKLSYLKQTFLLSYLCVTGGNIIINKVLFAVIISGFLSSFFCLQTSCRRQKRKMMQSKKKE